MQTLTCAPGQQIYLICVMLIIIKGAASRYSTVCKAVWTSLTHGLKQISRQFVKIYPVQRYFVDE